MKVSREPATTSGIIYYETKKCTEYDAIISSHMTPAFLSDRIIKTDDITARKQQWPYTKGAFAVMALSTLTEVHEKRTSHSLCLVVTAGR